MADEEKEKNTPEAPPKEEINSVTESEIIVWLVFLLGFDGVCILLDLTGVGMGIAPFLQGAGTFSSGIWFEKSKGDKNAMKMQRQLIKYISNIAPFLPTLSIAFAIETYVHNHPEKFEKVEKAVNAKTPAK